MILWFNLIKIMVIQLQAVHKLQPLPQALLQTHHQELVAMSLATFSFHQQAVVILALVARYCLIQILKYIPLLNSKLLRKTFETILFWVKVALERFIKAGLKKKLDLNSIVMLLLLLSRSWIRRVCKVLKSGR